MIQTIYTMKRVLLIPNFSFKKKNLIKKNPLLFFLIKKNTKEYYLFLVFSIALLSIFSCGKDETKPPPTTELVYGSIQAPDNLIPILKINEEARYLTELIFDGLVNKTISPAGKLAYEPALGDGENWYEESSFDVRWVVTIYLRKGVFWHNGREFTADDVIYTWEAINESNSPLKGWLNTFIKSLEKTDRYTLRAELHLERSREAMNELFSSFKILPKTFYPEKGSSGDLPTNLNDGSQISKEFMWKPIGTGPFKIAERQASSVTLEVNPNYFLGKPRMDKIRMKRVEDYALLVKSLQNGELGLVFEVKPESFTQLENAPVQYQDYIPYSFYAIVYNVQHSPFNDSYFRRAINMATNKQQLAETLLSVPNISSYINTSVFPHNYEQVRMHSDQYLSSTSFDLQKAEDSLRRAQISSSFRLLVSSQLHGTQVIALANKYKSMMNAINVDVIVDDITQSTYTKKIEQREFDAVLFFFTGFDHFYDIRDIFNGSSSRNISGLQDENLNGLLDEFGQTLSYDKLAAVTQKIHQRIDELAPACFLFTLPRRAYYSQLLKANIHPEVGFGKVREWRYE